MLLVLLPVLAALYVWALRRRRPVALRYSSLSLVRAALPRTSRLRRHLPFALFLAAVASLVRRPRAPRGDPGRAHQPDHGHADHRRLGQHVLDGHPPQSPRGRRRRPPPRSSTSQSATTQIGIVAFSGFAEVVQAPTNDRGAAR